MATKVKNNLGAIRSLNTLNKNSRAAQKNLRKVSTGERITSAEDDASAYGISERMREKIRSLDQANQNAQNDMAMMRTAEGAVANIVDTLRTLKQKAIDSANDSNTDEDRRIMQKEVDQLLDQIDDNALVTFNGKFLVNGNMSSSVRTRTIFVCEGVSWFGTNPDDDAIFVNPMTGLKYAFRRQFEEGTLLGIEESDIVKVSHVINGETYTRVETVGQKSLGAFVLGNTLSMASVSYHYGHGTDTIQEWLSWGATIGHDWYTGEPIGMISVGNGVIYSAGCVEIQDPQNGGINYYLVDGTNTPVRVDNFRHSGIALISGYDFNNVDPNTGVAEIKHGLTAISITVMDSGGNIKKDVTNALKFKCLQIGQKASKGGDGSNGATGGAATFHVGAGANQSMAVGLRDMRASALGLKSASGANRISISTRDDALAAIDAFDNAINSALDQLTSIGAIEARLEYTIGNITTSTENVQASDSTNRDADMAKEMTAYTRGNILMQAAQAMLAQANQDASSVLGLLS